MTTDDTINKEENKGNVKLSDNSVQNLDNSKTTRKQGFAAHPENINRNGRPRKGDALTDIMREYLDGDVETSLEDGTKIKRKRGEILAQKVFAAALRGNSSAMTMIWNYMDGKPKQPLELDHTVHNKFLEMSEKELREFLMKRGVDPLLLKDG